MITADDILNASILIVDDEESGVMLLEQLLRDAGYRSVTFTRNPAEVCRLHAENGYDLILLDLQMPVMDGFQVMEALRASDRDDYLPVLVVTVEPDHKLRALQAGAKDFISKPFDLLEVRTRIHNLLEVRLLYKKLKSFSRELQESHDELETIVHQRTLELIRANLQLTEEVTEHRRTEASLKASYEEIRRLKEKLQAENIYLQQEVDGQFNFGEIVGQSSLLAKVFYLVDQVASMNVTVLLLGETGTGKGVIARAIHSRSDRRDRPLITVNCTTLPSTLIESELFGREKGAFTGSDALQVGRFELADGGTLFLDEIGELPVELQSKLLRVIQDGEFERLGSPRTIKCDVRIIAATNRNLKEEVRSGRFREDLYYRLNVFPITMPPLRQRKEDIPLLVRHFVAKFNKKIGRRIEAVSAATLAVLEAYQWPGNVRELESVIERAVITSQGSTLTVPDHFDAHHGMEAVAGSEAMTLDEMEHDHITKVLKQTGWRIEGKNGAAVLLGINASTLRGRIRKLGIVRER